MGWLVPVTEVPIPEEKPCHVGKKADHEDDTEHPCGKAKCGEYGFKIPVGHEDSVVAERWKSKVYE
jgi:hypothetical protein